MPGGNISCVMLIELEAPKITPLISGSRSARRSVLNGRVLFIGGG